MAVLVFHVGFIWLGFFFLWGATWVRPPGRSTTRYMLWVLIALLAAIHFAMQLTAQVIYIKTHNSPEWLEFLGFPNKPSLQKLQV